MKVLGLDLGTNSIGWAIRDTATPADNQIIDYGVTVFKKGVGNGESGEFSLAAERRKNRSKRRLYNAKRYRKWELLRVLIKHGMCPLSIEGLRLWSVGNWQVVDGKRKNLGRIYPLSNVDFMRWLALAPEYFGDKGKSGNGKPIRRSPYDLRCELIEAFEKDDQKRNYKIGRALYHLAQRRGFKTSRKSGKSRYEAEASQTLSKFYLKYPGRKDWPMAKVFSYLQSDECDDNELKLTRIRKETGIQKRDDYLKEFDAICERQNLPEELKAKLHDAIYFVRGPRGQKGLVGKCTLEKRKPRIPISHPAFEEFRALSFINNIQWRQTGNKEAFGQIPMELRKRILEDVFFKTKKKSGFVDERAFFKFDEIVDDFSENGKWEFNYRNKPNVSTCPVIAGLMNTFKDEWKDRFIQDKDRYGINWDGLTLSYKLRYTNRNEARDGLKRKGQGYVCKKAGEQRTLDHEGIWHLLFNSLQTKDKPEALAAFCEEVLGWKDENKVRQFAEINVQQGYGSLSRKAIVKIIPYLQEGHIYSEAVSFANLSKVMGEKEFSANKGAIEDCITDVIKRTNNEKQKLNIVNSLIQNYFGEIETIKAEGLDEQIKESAKADVERKLKNYFGERNWNDKSEADRREYSDFVLNKYVSFLDRKQQPKEKASSSQEKNPEIDYYKIPRLDEAIKQLLRDKFSVGEKGLTHLYHPSDIQIYPPSRNDRLGNPEPPSKGWKNPMAMRTMHELRNLMNYLLEEGKIDQETKIVVEMARELNDTNKRWAIQNYQRRREEENIEFAKAILGVAKDKYPGLNENDADNIDKVRLWWEQLEDGEEVYKQIKALKEDVQKYRLWKEQQCQCIYTGKFISLTDLFDGTRTQFAHTFQRSESFDNSLANLTVSDAYYNVNIQRNRIPTQLENYKVDWKDPVSGNTYTAIEPRIMKWIEKRDSLQERIEDNKAQTQRVARSGDTEGKNELIKRRRYLELEFEYWDKKVRTFTLEDIPNFWKHSQLVDTQIITKYARAYMKSLFHKVDVQKGIITSEFKKIYGIMGDEKKDRSRHSHHAMDAAVLTLIPGSAKREEILRQYYRSLDKGIRFHSKPYLSFDITHVTSIDQNVLINHVNRYKTLVATYKKIRKRGKPQQSENGADLVMQGDSIRGQLHKETFLGAIKVPERNSHGYAVKENGQYLVQKNKTTEEDEIWLVVRKPIEDAQLDKIVDPLLRERIREQMNRGVKMEQVVDFNGKRIRHVRCKVSLPSYEKSLRIKPHLHLSEKTHKQYYRTDNSENYLCIYYEGTDERGRPTNAFRFVSLFEYSKLKDKDIMANLEYSRLVKLARRKEVLLTAKHIFKVGNKVILYRDSAAEIQKNGIPIEHVFRVYKFNNSGADYIFLQNVIEARENDELGDGETRFNPDKYQPRLKLTAQNLRCLVEHTHFEVKPDGEIILK